MSDSDFLHELSDILALVCLDDSIRLRRIADRLREVERQEQLARGYVKRALDMETGAGETQESMETMPPRG